MVFAARRIADENPELAKSVGLLLVVSEEVDHVGMVVSYSYTFEDVSCIVFYVHYLPI